MRPSRTDHRIEGGAGEVHAVTGRPPVMGCGGSLNVFPPGTPLVEGVALLVHIIAEEVVRHFSDEHRSTARGGIRGPDSDDAVRLLSADKWQTAA